MENETFTSTLPSANLNSIHFQLVLNNLKPSAVAQTQWTVPLITKILI
jgi:hypothetical protein